LLAERLRDELTQAGMQVRWLPFDGGHTIAPSVLAALGEMISG
jgi:predicted esterase